MSVLRKVVGYLLYLIFGISVIIMALFYFGEKLIDQKAYDAKMAKIEAQAEPVYTQVPSEEIIADESSAEEGEEETVQLAPPVVPQVQSESIKSVKFSFFEKLVYYKTDIAIIWGYILLGLTLVLALVFPLILMFSSVKNLLRTLGFLAAAAVLVVIAYALASGTPIPIPGYDGTDNYDPVVLKLVDTGIFLTYFLTGLALLSILYSEVAKAFK